ncbi:hypothetical protein DLAC_03876 [Tieghemostelium lacteum]|uniref:Uncharacterized protein n=1 Tax=Tieghemostelium lacteum TaxID=361077 RepID=A0A152A116_TIELA|nr:hypothetical protein DLAC_03876 [Tieghemostelium lacteum]|eukprot:KYQ99909.1 hypothetical protein DLAC_03876 [Tieghemostelium lacteum]
MSNLYNPYAPTPSRRSSSAPVVNPSIDTMPPIETLNPDTLKELTKTELTTYLQSHNIIPGTSKPEMKKQMRTLIHALQNKEPILITPPPNVNIPPLTGFNPLLQPMQGMQGMQGMQAMGMQGMTAPNIMGFNPYANPMSMLINPINPFLSQPTGALPNYMSPQQMTNPYGQPQQLYQPQQLQLHPPPMPQQMPPSTPITSSTIIAPQLNLASTPLKSDMNATPSSAVKKTPKAQAEDKEVESPRGKSDKDKDVPSDQCRDCIKKMNKECTNHRCRGCCVKYMIDSKVICLIHIKDESRRPRTKESPYADTIQTLIQQAAQQYPNYSFGSLGNTPPNTTPTLSSKSNTPGDSLKNSPILPSNKAFQLQAGNGQSALSPARPGQPPTNTTTPVQQQFPGGQIQTTQMHPPQPQMTQMQPPQQPQHIIKDINYGRKVQSQLQFFYINMQAQVAACSNPKRQSAPKEDKFAYFSCYKCEKVFNVNGSHFWKHLQSDHPEEFIKFLKENIKLNHSLSENPEKNDTYQLSRQRASDKYQLTIQWLQELFSPVPPPEFNDHTQFELRKEKIIEFDKKMDEMFNLFDSKKDLMNQIKNDSQSFDEYYNRLNVDDFESVSQQYIKDKNLNFQPKPSTVTQIHTTKPTYEFIESDSNFSIQSL